MCPLNEWEELEEPPRARAEASPARPAAAVAAALALGRLDRAWTHADGPTRAAWRRGALDREAAASSALEGWRVPASELMAAAFDAPVAPAYDLRYAQRVRALLFAAVRRSPRQLFTANRLAALARREEGGVPGLLGPGRDSGRMEALEAALAPRAVRRWAALDPVSGIAALLADWQVTGAAEEIGGVAGRALAARWPSRLGTTPLPLVPVALGFRSSLGAWAPWSADWPEVFAGALAEGLAEALALLDAIAADKTALLAWAAERRKPGPWTRLIDALYEAGGLSARRAARLLGLTPRAATGSLTALSRTPYVREISGRASWRVYAPRSLV